MDIADAMILRRLLTELFSRGVVMVTTSNRHPNDLYKNGIQRESFLPCIDLIKNQCSVLHLGSGIDYRRNTRRSTVRTYFSPLSEENKKQVDIVFKKLIRGRRPNRHTLRVLGRPVRIPQQCDRHRVARFSFEDVCGQALSSADYLEIVKHYDTLIVENIPALGTAQRNEARRFITLVDALYENKVCFIFSVGYDLRIKA